MKFYLGTHMPGWLTKLVDVPLFISRRRLFNYKRLPRATTPWSLDSGGFTEVVKYGGWAQSPSSYAADVRRFRDEIGMMDWAAPQDWMCELVALKATGLTIIEHLRRTVANFLELRSIAPDLPIVPVVQGFEIDDYRRCCDLYAAAGVDLAAERVVGLGSVCRRQGTSDAVDVVVGVIRHVAGIRLHGFGFKTQGVDVARASLASSDSLAWSSRGRRVKGAHGVRPKSCANCMHFALEWRDRLLSKPLRAIQPSMF